MRHEFDPKSIEQIDEALSKWHQGDICCDTSIAFVHLADLSRPHSSASLSISKSRITTHGGSQSLGIELVAEKEIEGFVVLTQTCDLVRSCKTRPFVEIAPLIKVAKHIVEETRRLKRVPFAYIPRKSGDCLVADLDRIMTVEKAVVAAWNRIHGCDTELEAKDFREAISRKRSRFPFPEDFVGAMQTLKNRILKEHNKQSDEGAHLQSLREIRVLATPSWDAANVKIKFFFIKDKGPIYPTWEAHVKRWLSMFKECPRFELDEPLIVELSGISAEEYLNSERFDLDSASTSRKPR